MKGKHLQPRILYQQKRLSKVNAKGRLFQYKTYNIYKQKGLIPAVLNYHKCRRDAMPLHVGTEDSGHGTVFSLNM